MVRPHTSERNPYRRSGPALRRVRALEGTLPTPARTQVLINSLSDPSLSVRRAAELRLSVQRDPAGLAGLAQLLRHGSDRARDRVTRVLAQWAIPPPDPDFAQAIAALARTALRDVMVWNRCRAAKLLGELGGTEDLPSLRACLSDPGSVVRIAAAQALVKLGDGACWEQLLALLDDPDTHDVAVRALITLEARGAAPALLARWIAEPGKRSIAKALGELGDAQAIEPLALGLEDPHCADEVALALLRLGDRRGWSQVREAFTSSKLHTSATLDAIADYGEPEDVAWVLDGPHLRSEYARYGSRAKRVLEELGRRDLRALERGLAHPEPLVRGIVANALGAFSCEEAGEQGSSALRAALADPEFGVAWNAARALGRRGDRAAVPELIAQIGQQHRARFVIPVFTEVLTQLGDASVVPALVRALPYHQDRGHNTNNDRFRLVAAITALGGDEHRSTYLQLLRDPDWRIRHRAIEALAQTPDARNFRALHEFVQSGAEAGDLGAVLRVLGAFSQPGAWELLSRALKSGNEWVRSSALSGLEQLRDARATDAILAALRHEHARTREAALWSAIARGLDATSWLPALAEYFAGLDYRVFGDRLRLLLRRLNELDSWPQGVDPARLREETILLRQRIRGRRLRQYWGRENFADERALEPLLDRLAAFS